ncbi:MAG: hypothetical protein PHG87_07300, partial [Candidatus Omnitrophica bacterium]|nr:hypothetical protein [Candidatus Omnitrophota bacterium]
EDEKPRKRRGKRKPGVVKAIRLILYKDPDTPAEEVIERVEQQGFSCSRATVETMIYEARQAIATFKELGMYKSPRKK